MMHRRETEKERLRHKGKMKEYVNYFLPKKGYLSTFVIACEMHTVLWSQILRQSQEKPKI